jgi:hypothetical protein
MLFFDVIFVIQCKWQMRCVTLKKVGILPYCNIKVERREMFTRFYAFTDEAVSLAFSDAGAAAEAERQWAMQKGLGSSWRPLPLPPPGMHQPRKSFLRQCQQYLCAFGAAVAAVAASREAAAEEAEGAAARELFSVGYLIH